MPGGRGATNAHGYAYGFHYGWSGGHRIVAEEMPDGRRQIQFGHATRLENESAKRFETAILYSVYSNDGINGCSVAFQRHLRDRIVRFPSSARPRPVHYNWLSDSHDAVERLAMQHNAAIFLPMAVTGSHVGPRTCHTSGRTSDIRFRAWVAAQRYLGFEMDPRELTPEETRVLGKVIRWWKENRDWMQIADILRLDSSDKAVIAEQQLEQGGGQFVVFAGKSETSAQIAPRPLRLTRLSADRNYRIELVNHEDAPALSRCDQAIKSGPLTLSGAYLMNRGLALPWSFPETMWVLKGTLVYGHVCTVSRPRRSHSAGSARPV